MPLLGIFVLNKKHMHMTVIKDCTEICLAVTTTFLQKKSHHMFSKLPNYLGIVIRAWLVS